MVLSKDTPIAKEMLLVEEERYNSLMHLVLLKDLLAKAKLCHGH